MLQPSNHLGGPLDELSSVFQHLCLTGISVSAGEIGIISPLAAEVRRISAHAWSVSKCFPGAGTKL